MRLSPNQIYTDFMQTVANGGVTNPYALAAIASTGTAESGFSASNADRTWNDGINNAGGIMSWNGPRLAALQRFSGGTNGTPKQQAAFFLQENPALIQKLNGAGSLQEAQQLMNNAWAFKGYDQPGNANAAHRLHLAGQYLKQFSGGQMSDEATGYVDPQVASAARNDSAGAVNAMAHGTLTTPNLVHTVQFVPPPNSGQQGSFQPLFSTDAPQANQQQEQAAPQPQQTAAPQADDSAILKSWGLDGTESAPQANVEANTPAQNTDDALIKAWGLDKTDAAPAEGLAKAPGTDLKTYTPPIAANDAVRSVATGIPVVGGLLNRMDAATNALIAPVVNPLLSQQNRLAGDTFSQRYANSLAEQEGLDKTYAEQHPIANTVGNVAGAIGGTIPMIAAAPAAMGASATASLPANMLMGGVTGAGIGAADTAVRDGVDPETVGKGALYGAVGGAAGPALGEALGIVGNKLLNFASRTSTAARNVLGALKEADMTPQQAQNILSRMGPEATLADVDPALAAEAGGLAAQGGAPTSILKKAMLARSAGADDRIVQSAQTTLGPRPDLTATQEAIAAKATADASPHYQNAGNAPLDASGVLGAIDKRLETANGAEKAILTKFKSYFTDPAAGDLGAQTQKAAGDGLNDITSHMAQSGPPDPGLDAARSILVRAQNGSMDAETARQALSQLQSSDPAAQKLISDAVGKLSSVTPLKTDPEALLKVRQAMDDDIQKAPMSDTTGGKNAERAANDIRGELDKVLKTNQGIKQGDAAYALQMRNKDALQEGTEIFKNGTKIEDWRRSIAGKTPEQVQNMQTGALSSLWDALDNGRNGDWSAIRSLLGKSTANRQKLEALFPGSQDVFDTIANEAAMRGTEQTVARNSETALRQAIAAKYARKPNALGGTPEAVVGEALAGGPGAVAGFIGRNALNAVKNSLAEKSRNALMEQTARGLAATGPEQQAFINQLQRAALTQGATAGISGGAQVGSNLLTRTVADRYRQNRLTAQ
jgi:hypothetical protein